MAEYRNQNFKAQAVHVDGNAFIDCAFEGCQFVYNGGTLPLFTGGSMRDCGWVLDGAALRTLRLLTDLYKGGGGSMVEDLFEQIRGKRAAAPKAD